MKFDTLYMSHVRPIGTRKDLDDQIKLFEDLYAAVDQSLKAGTPLFDIPDKVQLPQWKNLLMYDQWLKLNLLRICIEKDFGQ